MVDESAGFAATYGVELLCETQAQIDKKRLLAALRRFCPRAIPLGEDESGPLAFVHPDHPIQHSAGSIGAQTFVAVANKPLDRAQLAAACERSRRFEAAAEVVARCHYSVLVTDFMAAAGLEYRERLELFLRTLAGALDAIPCLAIHWMRSQQISAPDAFRTPVTLGDAERLFAGPFNVRFYRISNSPGDMLMDTLGLAALGLPDIQCHFRKLDPLQVSSVVGNVGYYLLQKGDIINDRETVEGIERGQKWVCQHEQALVPPAREVLDLNPGKSFAAGNRR